MELLDAGRLEEVSDLCRRCLPDPPTKDELSASLFSPDQSVAVLGETGVGIVATVCAGTQGYIRLLGVDPAARATGARDALCCVAPKQDLSGTWGDKCAGGCRPSVLPLPGGGIDTHGDAVPPRTASVPSAPSPTSTWVWTSTPFLRTPGATSWRRRATTPRWRRGCAPHWPNWEAEAMRALERSTLVISRDDERDRRVLRL